MSNGPIEILLVEDNPADVEITKQSLRRAKITNQLHVATSGDEALAFLRQAGKYEQAPRPTIVLLDLNLPGMDGREVLREIKADERLRVIPVIVLTSSRAEEDVLGAYHTYANAFMTKPIDFGEFVQLITTITEYWCTLVELPSPD